MMSTPSPAKTTNADHIGRYGTISLLKRRRSSSASSSSTSSDSDVLTAFGIDTPSLTFGRDLTCGVRLYYADVAHVHCRIVFNEEKKAFLRVAGEGGVLVDGCAVYPTGAEKKEEATIPLTNGSEFEIHGKRFRFSYPPKEMRAALYASPIPTRMPRLSLIQSTHVFSPRPSPDPRENLRVLQSPLKNTFLRRERKLQTPMRKALFAKYQYNSPAKPLSHQKPEQEDEDEEDDEPEEDIVLVDGNHPRVVEDERDLVILEDIAVLPPAPIPHAPIPSRPLQLHAPQPQQPQPKTPTRARSLSRNTLHRAVLIRSAQRAVMQAEREEEEEREEMEVLSAVAGLADESEDDKEEEQEQDVEMDVEMDMEVPLAFDTSSGSSDEEPDEERQGRKQQRAQQKQKMGWRKSLERLWPFRSSSPSKETPEDDTEEDEDEDPISPIDPPGPRDSSSAEEEETEDIPAPLPQHTPARPPVFGKFMTPQPQVRIGASTSDPTLTHGRAPPQGAGQGGRFSLGGGAPQRVPRAPEQVWKVRDIVVPAPNPPATPAARLAPSTPRPVNVATVGVTPRPTPRKKAVPGVGEDERKAIQERRRSALRDAGEVGFVPGMGMSPMKPLWSPVKASSSSSSALFPTTPARTGTAGIEEEEAREGGGPEGEDTRALLERMKETVEGMKRRRSLAPSLPPVTPRRTPPTPIRRSPSKASAVMEVHAEAEDNEDDEKEGDKTFSLLRPGVLDEIRAAEVEVMEVDENQPITPNVIETPASPVRGSERTGIDIALGNPSPAHDPTLKPPAAKMSRASRSRSPAVMVIGSPADIEVDVQLDEPPPKPRSRSKANSKPKPQAPVQPPSVLVTAEDDAASSMEVDEQQQPEHVKPSSKSKSGSKVKTPTRRTTRAKTPTPEHEVQGEHLGLEEPERTKPRSKSKSVRTAGPESEEEDPELANTKPSSKSKPKLKTPARQTTRVQPSPPPEEDTEEVVPPVPKARGRKAAVQHPEQDEVEEVVAPAKRRPKAPTPVPAPEPEPVRRGRKGTIEPKEAPSFVPKRGRKATATVEEGVEAVEEVPAPAKRGARKVVPPPPPQKDALAPVRKARTPRAGTAASIAKSSVAQGSETIDVDDETPDVETADKKPSAKGRKRAATIKREATEEGLAAPPVATAAATKPRALKTPAATAAGRARKTPATAPAASAVQVPEVDKENTQKMRVSRKKKEVEADGDVGEEDEEATKEAPRGRVMRTTRARTRT
ncbi:hypothetical protein DXG01_002475 [Tephrocybe rancida]|nr:hypothetical protein DXG01_002475 [Tephrocybe rancida]